MTIWTRSRLTRTKGPAANKSIEPKPILKHRWRSGNRNLRPDDVDPGGNGSVQRRPRRRHLVGPCVQFDLHCSRCRPKFAFAPVLQSFALSVLRVTPNQAAGRDLHRQTMVAQRPHGIRVTERQSRPHQLGVSRTQQPKCDPNAAANGQYQSALAIEPSRQTFRLHLTHHAYLPILNLRRQRVQPVRRLVTIETSRLVAQSTHW